MNAFKFVIETPAPLPTDELKAAIDALTDAEYAVTFPIPSIEPLNPADALIGPVTFNEVSTNTPFTPLTVIVCKLSSIFT